MLKEKLSTKDFFIQQNHPSKLWAKQRHFQIKKTKLSNSAGRPALQEKTALSQWSTPWKEAQTEAHCFQTLYQGAWVVRDDTLIGCADAPYLGHAEEV